jgi:hypothetical protein
MKKFGLVILLLIFLSAIKGDKKSLDLYVLTIPKSGTTLLVKALQLITTNSSIHPIVWQMRDKDPEKMLTKLSSQLKTGIFYYDHFYNIYEPDIFFKLMPEKKVILLIRDPRDVLISALHSFPRYLPKYINKYFPLQKISKKEIELNKYWLRLNRKERLKFLIQAKPDQYIWTMNYPRQFKLLKKWSKHPNVYLCNFENLIGEKGGSSVEEQMIEIEGMAEYLGVVLSEKKLKEIIKNAYGGTWSFYSGKKISKWKDDFDNEIKKIFKKEFGKYLIHFGYEQDNNW